jgi:DNA-binding LacI/PurR family transcriptional regulator
MNDRLTDRRASKTNRIADQLRRRIALGDLKEGTYLPSERELAEQMQVGRSTVAGALEILVSQGYVERNERRGTRVLQASPVAATTTIRLIHWLDTTPNIHWMEGSELLRGMEDTIEPLSGFSAQRYCYKTGNLQQPIQMPDSPAPSVLLEAVGEQLAYVHELQRLGLPVVVANLEFKDPSIDATWTDHGRSMCEAIELLVQMGHRRIGYIGYDPSYMFYGLTEQAYIKSMKCSAGRFDESMICQVERKVPAVLAGYQAAQRMLQLDDPPTAIVATLDNFAEGAWSAIEQAGLIVGHDVSLIGYDDLTWSGDEQKLTTFREPAHEMGAKAAQMVIDRIVNGPKPIEQIEFPAKLIMRRSVGPCRQNYSDQH